MPVSVFEEEVHAAVRFWRRYQKPQRGQNGERIPGLADIERSGLLGEKIDEELLQLYQAYSAAEKRRRLLDDPVSQDDVTRSREALSDIKAVLAFCLQSDRQAQAQLAALSRAHRRARSHPAIAAALFDYAELAERHARELSTLGGFDPKMIDEALSLGRALRERSAKTPDAAQRDEAMDLRNRFGRLIEIRLRSLRAAARFVFRNHPDIVREVTSRYGRERQATWRKRRGARSAE